MGKLDRGSNRSMLQWTIGSKQYEEVRNYFTPKLYLTIGFASSL